MAHGLFPKMENYGPSIPSERAPSKFHENHKNNVIGATSLEGAHSDGMLKSQICIISYTMGYIKTGLSI